MIVFVIWLLMVAAGFAFCYWDTRRRGSVKIRLMFYNYDCWVGLYYDEKKEIWYWFPLPMLGVRFVALKK